MGTSPAVEIAERQAEQFDDQWAIGYTRGLIKRIVDECPRRYLGSPGELKAQEILRDEMTREGGVAEFLPYRFNTSLYAVIALHFGLAALAGLLQLASTAVALALHLLVAVSFVGDSLKYYFLLRRVLPWRQSQNLIVTFPARRQLRRRIVVLGHADAAPTGWIFHRSLVRLLSKEIYGRPLRILRKPIQAATLSLLLVIALDVQMLTIPWFSWWLVGAYWLCHVHFLAVSLLNLQVALSREVVDGANDNLTACAAAAVLARRLAPDRDDDVELVLGVTGGEEAGDGGSTALAREMSGQWDRSRTVVIALECLGAGRLRVLRDGEIVRRQVPAWLMAAAEKAADASDQPIGLYALPAGCTDALPFLVRGYDGLCFIRIDPEIGVPANYHLPSDRPENIHYGQLVDAIGFVERFVREIARPEQRPGG